jgi:pre-mRNA-processing factor 6
LLKSKLNQIEQKQSTVDRVGYLTQLSTAKINPEMIGDISRARLLLKSAVQSNPKNADIWISAARVEELDGKLNEAR